MIEKILAEYRDITEKIIKDINNDEEVMDLMEKREELINTLFNNEENKYKIRELYLEKGLLNLDKELKISIDKERNKVKEEINNIHKIKSANNAYERNRKNNSFFNVKI